MIPEKYEKDFERAEAEYLDPNNDDEVEMIRCDRCDCEFPEDEMEKYSTYDREEYRWLCEGCSGDLT